MGKEEWLQAVSKYQSGLFPQQGKNVIKLSRILVDYYGARYRDIRGRRSNLAAGSDAKRQCGY